MNDKGYRCKLPPIPLSTGFRTKATTTRKDPPASPISKSGSSHHRRAVPTTSTTSRAASQELTNSERSSGHNRRPRSRGTTIGGNNNTGPSADPPESLDHSRTNALSDSSHHRGRSRGGAIIPRRHNNRGVAANAIDNSKKKTGKNNNKFTVSSDRNIKQQRGAGYTTGSDDDASLDNDSASEDGSFIGPPLANNNKESNYQLSKIILIQIATGILTARMDKNNHNLMQVLLCHRPRLLRRSMEPRNFLMTSGIIRGFVTFDFSHQLLMKVVLDGRRVRYLLWSTLLLDLMVAVMSIAIFGGTVTMCCNVATMASIPGVDWNLFMNAVAYIYLVGIFLEIHPVVREGPIPWNLLNPIFGSSNTGVLDLSETEEVVQARRATN